MQPPSIIAEVGCNHQGQLDLAERHVRSASVCGVDVVKFQKRTPREMLTAEEFAAPHPVPENTYGDSYGAHREALELDADQHQHLKRVCERNGVEYGVSVWDVTAAREMIALKPRTLKVPSARNMDWALLGVLCHEFPGDLHVSLGMVTATEQAEIARFLRLNRRERGTMLYACTSGYPVPPDEVYLLELARIRKWHSGFCVGFSGHHLGTAIDMAAVALGAEAIERHFTLDRSWRGTDHAASLEPVGLRQLVRDVREVTRALRSKPRKLPEIEAATRRKLRPENV